jgi:hypothetical protein
MNLWTRDEASVHESTMDSQCDGGVTSPEHTPTGDCSHRTSTQAPRDGEGRSVKLVSASVRCGVAGDELIMTARKG